MTAAFKVPQTDEHGRKLGHVATMDKIKGDLDSLLPDLGESTDEGTYDFWTEDFPNIVVSALQDIDEHKPILDLDFPCRLVPSQTPGHFHLFMDGITMSTADYHLMMMVLAKVGVLQQRWVNNMNTQGTVAVRYPSNPLAVPEPVMEEPF